MLHRRLVEERTYRKLFAEARVELVDLLRPGWFKGGDGIIGGFGGGWLEHPRQWLGAEWAGLFLGVPSCPEPPGASRGVSEAEARHR